jgi:ABC-2 type transport system ATP-binding protein
MSTAVSIDGISKQFGASKALDEVSFDVPMHSIFGLLGPNGAGKTTLFSIAAGFLFADQGRIEVLGHNVRQLSKLRGRVSILPQDAEFQRNTPIMDQLVFLRMLEGQNRANAEREVEESLELVGLGDYARRGARVLSHGMAKRLGIAQAFLGTPEVILLDEPTAGLDPANARQIRDLIQRLHERATIVVSSHNLAEIQALCDHVAILDEGKVVNCGSVAELTSGSRELDMRLSRALGDVEVERLSGLPGIVAIDAAQAPEYRLRLDLSGGRDWDQAVGRVLQALLELGAVPRSLHEGKSLERHFLDVTGKAEANPLDTEAARQDG